MAIVASAGTPLRAEQSILYFSAIPDQDETKLVERFSKIAAYLEKETGVPVKYVPVKSYPAAVTAFRNGQVQLAWFGGLSGVQARLSTPGSVAIAQGEEDQTFISYFIAHESTGLKPSENFPAEAAGMSFTFGAKTSTSGRLMPEYYIREKTGKKPNAFFSRVGFSGNHSQTLRLVASGAYQVGALNFKVYDTALSNESADVKTAKLIWKTPPYPDYNWTVRGDIEQTFGKGFIKKLQQALLDMKDPDLLAAFPRRAFIPAGNDDYAQILDTAQQIGLISK